jgi:hypothetical protein
MRGTFWTGVLVSLSCGVVLISPALASTSQTDSIDEALLRTRLTVLGIDTYFSSTYASRSNAKAILACIHSGVTPIVREHFSTAMKTALTPSELDVGSKLALPVVSLDLAPYILANREVLIAEAERDHAYVSHYLITTAATRLNHSESELEDVTRFVSWDATISRKVDTIVKQNSPALMAKIREVTDSCAP